MRLNPKPTDPKGKLKHKALESPVIDFSLPLDDVIKATTAAIAKVGAMTQYILEKMPDGTTIVSMDSKIIRGVAVADPEFPDDIEKYVIDQNKAVVRVVIAAYIPE